MKKFAGVTFLIVGVILAGMATAHAQSMKAECYERSNLLYTLATEHGERLDQTRRVGATGLLEAFKSPTGGTWTIIYSNDEGLSCVLASGEGLVIDSTPRPEFDV